MKKPMTQKEQNQENFNILEKNLQPFFDLADQEERERIANRSPNIGYCDWCENKHQHLEYHVIRIFDESRILVEGWLSPDCYWLAMQAKEAIDNDE